MRGASILLYLFAAGMLGVGAWQAFKQQTMIRSAVPVEAQIITPAPTVKVQTSGSGRRRSTTYTPVIHYRFTIDGQTRTSHNIFAYKNSTSQSRANQLVAEHRIGRRVTAYASPADPSVAFLLREWLFEPYVFMLFSMIFVGIAALIQTSVRPRAWHVPQPAAGKPGWHE